MYVALSCDTTVVTLPQVSLFWKTSKTSLFFCVDEQFDILADQWITHHLLFEHADKIITLNKKENR